MYEQLLGARGAETASVPSLLERRAGHAISTPRESYVEL